MTTHFSALTEAEQERLAILIEECSEVIQSGCKILRHGYESNNKGQMSETNREQLQRELGDLLHALSRMETSGDVSQSYIDERSAYKGNRISPYLHHN